MNSDTEFVIYRECATAGVIQKSETIPATSAEAAARKALGVQRLHAKFTTNEYGERSRILPYVDTPSGPAYKFFGRGSSVWVAAATVAALDAAGRQS